MRKEETWKEKILPKLINKFTPRIQEDLRRIEWPKILPKEIGNQYLFGDTGAGKTIYAAFLCLQESKLNYLAEDTSGKDFIFVSFPELFLEIKSTFDNKAVKEVDIINKYKDVHLLVLDDFGVKNGSDWFMEILYIIINHRYEYMKKTIFTSNSSIEEASKQMNDIRIAARIERMCKVTKKKSWK